MRDGEVLAGRTAMVEIPGRQADRVVGSAIARGERLRQAMIERAWHVFTPRVRW